MRFVIILLGCTIFTVAAKKCTNPRKPNKLKNCDGMLYRELKCQILSYGKSGCPDYYHCPSLNVDEGHCRYRGVQYNIGDAIKNKKIPRCRFACTCAVGEDSNTLVSCAMPRCALPPYPVNCTDCYTAHADINECCPTVVKSPTLDNIATCKVDNVVYKEGEIFFPNNSCKECICQEGFSGKLTKPFCRDVNCGTELVHAAKLEDNCAPIYEKDACCPDVFLCPEDIPSIIIEFAKNRRQRKAACYFGCNRIPLDGCFNTTYTNNDDGISFDVSCSCVIPPFLNCIKV